jgi:hypothetical protein
LGSAKTQFPYSQDAARAILKAVCRRSDRHTPYASCDKRFSSRPHSPQERRAGRFLALCGSAALAKALACVGIYGVMACLVSRRNREIGVRLALGARPGSIFRSILGHGPASTVTGEVVGIGGALGTIQLMRRIHYGVSPISPFTIARAAIPLTRRARGLQHSDPPGDESRPCGCLEA